ncbi:MAG: tRNA (guanosine(46)-N7)-methyltransferase TrmB [Eubacteriaceae bacterium]
MHIRPKPWARPELEASHFFQTTPTKHRGEWKTIFPESQPLHIELGCGKGTFISQIGIKNPNINFLAIDLIDAVLGLAKRNIETTYDQHRLAVKNIQLMSWDIERIDQILTNSDNVERIYINFCNPWPKRRHQKKRLTHPKQLQKYLGFLKEQGEIYFKTDNAPLFEDSIHYFRECGFQITTCIEDLHHSDYQGNIETEHEKLFSSQGVKIKFLIAQLT